MNQIAVADKVVGSALRRRDALDALGGDLAQPLHHPVGGPRHGGDEGAVADGGVGAREDEVVGEGGAGQGEVGFWFVGPFVGEGEAVAADDGEVRDVAGVEARGADDYVEGDGFVGGLDAGCGDASDR